MQRILDLTCYVSLYDSVRCVCENLIKIDISKCLNTGENGITSENYKGYVQLSELALSIRISIDSMQPCIDAVCTEISIPNNHQPSSEILSQFSNIDDPYYSIILLTCMLYVLHFNSNSYIASTQIFPKRKIKKGMKETYDAYKEAVAEYPKINEYLQRFTYIPEGIKF